MFVPVSDEQMSNLSVRRKLNDNTGEIERFLESGVPCAEYILPEGSRASICRSSFAQTIKRGNLPARIVKRGERLFFIRKEV